MRLRLHARAIALPLLTSARCASCKMTGGWFFSKAPSPPVPTTDPMRLQLHQQPEVIGAIAVIIAVLVVILTRALLRLLTGRRDPALCIHFDVNETIMLGDPAGGDSFDDSLHKILAKIAFVRPVPPAARGSGRWAAWVWHDGSPLDPLLRDPTVHPPPLLPDAFADPPGCVRFYNVPELKRAFAKTFAAEGSPGAIYATVHSELRAAMRWPDGAPRDPRLCSPDGYHRFLPAFFETLVALRRARRRVAVVVRTFGTDLPALIAAIDAFAEGQHPLHPGLHAPELRIPPGRTWAGFYSHADGAFTLRRDPGGSRGRQTPASAAEGFASEGAMLAALEGPLVRGMPRLSAVQDDYDWWKDAGYAPAAGKPLWLSLHAKGAGGGGCRHIFFDDNIHCDPLDSIVAVRVRASSREHVPFAPVSGRGTVALHGAVLRKVPTAEPVRDPGWFLKQIAACEARIDEMRDKDAKGQPGGFVEMIGM